MVSLHKYSAIDESGVALKQPDCNANFVQFDFTKANVVHSNLGGFGPDDGDKTIKYANVGKNDETGDSIDLIVSIDPSHEKSFSAERSPQTSGLQGKSGQISLDSGFEAFMKFRFVKTGTNKSQILPAFYFSIFVIDQSFKAGEDPHQTGQFLLCKSLKTLQLQKVHI